MFNKSNKVRGACRQSSSRPTQTARPTMRIYCLLAECSAHIVSFIKKFLAPLQSCHQIQIPFAWYRNQNHPQSGWFALAL